jgi:ethanolamine permease
VFPAIALVLAGVCLIAMVVFNAMMLPLLFVVLMGLAHGYFHLTAGQRAIAAEDEAIGVPV